MGKGRLRNEFSWSFSRDALFQECPKKYWFTYYGSWEGWPLTRYDARPSVDPLAAYLYRQKQMQLLPMYVGTVVHTVIERGLKDRLQHRRELQGERMREQARALYLQGIQDAKEEKWRVSPKKHPPLFEVYYGEKGWAEPLHEEQVQQGLEKVLRCVDNWISSPIVQRLLLDGRAHWLSIEELESFYLDGVFKVFVVMDFAMKWRQASGETLTLLFDWKTGAETDKTIDQLYSYALFAHEVWGVEYEKLLLTPFYLFDNRYEKIGSGQERPIQEDKLEATKRFIRESCAGMAAKIEGYQGDPESLKSLPNEAKVMRFPYTAERHKCGRCPFRELCQGMEYREVDEETLRHEGLGHVGFVQGQPFA